MRRLLEVVIDDFDSESAQRDLDEAQAELNKIRAVLVKKRTKTRTIFLHEDMIVAGTLLSLKDENKPWNDGWRILPEGEAIIFSTNDLSSYCPSIKVID